MSISKTQARLITGAYAFVRRTGALETSAGKQLFIRSYNLYKRVLEDPFYRLARNYPSLFRGGNIFDIGANIGYTAKVFAAASDPGSHVFAFEPEPFNFGLLEETARRASGRIVPIQAAVGAGDGNVELWLNRGHHADHRVATEHYRETRAGDATAMVPLVSIDSFSRSRPGPVSFIKIDVQGYELAVCEGMCATVAENPSAAIAVEYMPEALDSLGFSPELLTDWFQRRNYLVYQIRNDGTLVPGLPNRIPDGGYADLLYSKTPCHRVTA